MKVKTSELTGAALDWAVAKCEGYQAVFTDGTIRPVFRKAQAVEATWPEYSTDWAQGGPIIERKKISIIEECDGTWMGSIGGCTDLDTPLYQEHGLTQLISAMRCYVASELGDEVEMPEELA
jgi:hypothetical protein